MADNYIGEIRMFAGTFAPEGWLFCNGSLLSISDYPELFQLIGTTYGGDGVTTFGLPNLSSRFPVHQGPGYTMGQSGGQESVVLSTAQLPQHAHTARGRSDAGNQNGPGNGVWAQSNARQFAPGPPDGSTFMAGDAVASSGGGQGHDNTPPFLGIHFIIATFGIFPTQQ